jgi:sensor c-di-GMP phosphodiesterase-like protein
MISLFKKRPWVTVAAMLAAAVCGAGIGYVMGGAITLSLAMGKLQQYAMRLLDNDAASSREARSVLAALNASTYPHCSDAELHYFRNLIYQAEYLKDAGSIRDGKIECSANMGRPAESLPLPKPKFVQHDGITVYEGLTPPEFSNLKSIALQLGGSYVVFNGYNFTRLKLPSMHFVTTESDLPKKQIGKLKGEDPGTQEMVLTLDHDGRSGSTLYATRCSVAYSDCVTAYVSIPEALQTDRSVIVGYVVLGGLFGVIFGLYCSSVYMRSQGMESQLRKAIREDKLQMVYQPIVELDSGRIVGAETLARWTDEDGIPVSPDVFVRLAEEYGFVGKITRLVVHHSLQDFAATLRAQPDFHISVNVAADDLADPGFLRMLDQELALAEVPAQSLTIEITESSTARHDVAIKTILALRQRGHSVHIDDFGTGYSSLSYLQDLAVDAIKIDRSFTRAVGTGAANAAILPQILGMAEALSLKVIVEGIETESQAAYFAVTGQPMLAQGWLYGKPLQIEQFHRRMAENKSEALLKLPVAWQGKLFSEEETSLISHRTA